MSSYLHADQPDGNGPLNVTPEREALIERLAAESRAARRAPPTTTPTARPAQRRRPRGSRQGRAAVTALVWLGVIAWAVSHMLWPRTPDE